MKFICTRCGSQFDKPRKIAPGSILIEIALWVFFLLPGLIYSLWRFNARKHVCPTCGATEFIPIDTPEGRRIQERRG